MKFIGFSYLFYLHLIVKTWFRIIWQSKSVCVPKKWALSLLKQVFCSPHVATSLFSSAGDGTLAQLGVLLRLRFTTFLRGICAIFTTISFLTAQEENIRMMKSRRMENYLSRHVKTSTLTEVRKIVTQQVVGVLKLYCNEEDSMRRWGMVSLKGSGSVG